MEGIGKFGNKHFQGFRILILVLILLTVCGIILVNIADKDGCDLMTGYGGLGCIGYGFAWYGCLFLVGLSVLLSIISYLLALKKSKVEDTVEPIHVGSKEPTDTNDRV